MHILFLTHHFPTPDEAGAPRPWQLAKYFSSRGHQVTVVAADYNYMSGARDGRGFNPRLWRTEEVGLEGVRCIRTAAFEGYKKSVFRRVIAYSSYSLLGFAGSLPVGDIDIVLTPNNPPTNTVFGYLLSRLKRAKFVEELREPHPEIDVALGYFTAQRVQRAYRQYHDFFHGKSDLIISLTPGITRILRHRGVPDSKIIEVPNAYDLENDQLLGQCTEEEAKAQLGWASKFVVLYAGSHGLAPDLRTLLEAAKRLRRVEDILFVLVGEGDKKGGYLAYAEQHGLGNCVFLAGQPREQMPLYYRAADVCTHLIPRGDFWDCILPNKIFDYLGSSTAVLFSGRGDTATLLRDAEAGLVVDAEDPEAFAEALLALHRDPARAQRLGQNGRRYVLANYSREPLFAKLEVALAGLLRR